MVDPKGLIGRLSSEEDMAVVFIPYLHGEMGLGNASRWSEKHGKPFFFTGYDFYAEVLDGLFSRGLGDAASVFLVGKSSGGVALSVEIKFRYF